MTHTVHADTQVFLKLKWSRCWPLYLIYMLLDFFFLISLGGFTLAHFGRIYDGQVNYEYGSGKKNVWWFLLAFCHVYKCAFTLARLGQMSSYLLGFCAMKKDAAKERSSILEKTVDSLVYLLRSMVPPILIGFVLYMDLSEDWAR